MFYQWLRFLGGLRRFQKEESRLKMQHAAEDFRLQEPIKISTESGRSYRLWTVRMLVEVFNLPF